MTAERHIAFETANPFIVLLSGAAKQDNSAPCGGAHRIQHSERTRINITDYPMWATSRRGLSAISSMSAARQSTQLIGVEGVCSCATCYAPFALAITGSAHASQLTPIEGLSVKLGNVAAMRTTPLKRTAIGGRPSLQSGGDTCSVHRNSVVRSGSVVSISAAFGQSAVELEIKRIEDRVVSDDTQLSSLDQ